MVVGSAVRQDQRSDVFAILENLNARRDRFEIGGVQRLLSEQHAKSNRCRGQSERRAAEKVSVHLLPPLYVKFVRSAVSLRMRRLGAKSTMSMPTLPGHEQPFAVERSEAERDLAADGCRHGEGYSGAETRERARLILGRAFAQVHGGDVAGAGQRETDDAVAALRREIVDLHVPLEAQHVLLGLSLGGRSTKCRNAEER